MDIAENIIYDILNSRLQHFNYSVYFSKDLHLIRQQNKFCGIIEHNTNAFITQLIAETIFITVIHPFGDPEQGLSGRICIFITQIALQKSGLTNKIKCFIKQHPL